MSSDNLGKNNVHTIYEVITCKLYTGYRVGWSFFCMIHEYGTKMISTDFLQDYPNREILRHTWVQKSAETTSE